MPSIFGRSAGPKRPSAPQELPKALQEPVLQTQTTLQSPQQRQQQPAKPARRSAAAAATIIGRNNTIVRVATTRLDLPRWGSAWVTMRTTSTTTMPPMTILRIRILQQLEAGEAEAKEMAMVPAVVEAGIPAVLSALPSQRTTTDDGANGRSPELYMFRHMNARLRPSRDPGHTKASSAVESSHLRFSHTFPSPASPLRMLRNSWQCGMGVTLAPLQC
mmetsp:Transcript_3442/g.7700  ORF Transcript_3442/g.7700 Transcript_3442/m.7700 type:complete len:218 (-) Transcript_3442:692-1345(-)